MTTLKRALSDRSPDVAQNKRLDSRVTPTKSEITVIHNMAEADKKIEEEARAAAFEEINNSDAPQWFKKAFSLISKDLGEIRGSIKKIDLCEDLCKQNTEQVEILTARVKQTEERSKNLEEQLMLIDLASRKKNLILHNAPETGPKEDAGLVIQNFFKDTIKLDKVIEPETVYRIGKPPHLQSTPTKRGRDIMIKLQTVQDRDFVWGARRYLKGTKFTLSEDLPPVMQHRRKTMLPYYLAARKIKHLGKCALIRDYLVLNGKKYYTDDIDKLPPEIQSNKKGQRMLNKLDGVAFYGGNCFLSNFYPCSFVEEGHTFTSVEKYFQYKKASYFNDEATAQQILKSSTPIKALTLSYNIKDFDEDMWNMVQRQIMYKGCALKFSQNKNLADLLKQTSGRIVEANPKETVFSCGLEITDPHVEDPTQWKGANLLGDILCELRSSL